MVMSSDIFAEPVTLHGVALAPDGRRVAVLYLRQGAPHLAVLAVDPPRLLTDRVLPTGRPGGLTWSPDGSLLAFYANGALYADGAPPTSDIYVLTIASGALRAMTASLQAVAHVPSWSPTGDQLAFGAYAPPVRADHPPHLFTVSLARGRIVQRTTGPAADFTPQFAPDGRTLAFRRAGNIWVLDMEGGGERQVTQAPDAALGHSCFAPDGAQIVVEYGPADARQVARVDLRSGAVHTLTFPPLDAWSPTWSVTSDAIALVADHREVQVLAPEGTLRWRARLPARGIMASPALGPRWAARAPVLAVGDTDSNIWIVGPHTPPQQITFFPAPAAPAPPEWVTYPSAEGRQVPALLYTAPSAGRAVVWVHGGPHAQEDPRSPYIQAAVGAGLSVLAPDYRGSTGHGEAWKAFAPGEPGVVDLADVVAGHNFLVTAGLATPRRIAVAGYSYGGYLALLALAHAPHHWAAGASLWGIFDARRSPPLLGDVLWRDAGWIAARSPAALLSHITAPLLILHGAGDTTSTVEEVRHAAATLTGQGVPCDLRIFWDDTHGLNRHTPECCALLRDFLRSHLG